MPKLSKAQFEFLNWISTDGPQTPYAQQHATIRALRDRGYIQYVPGAFSWQTMVDLTDVGRAALSKVVTK